MQDYSIGQSLASKSGQTGLRKLSCKKAGDTEKLALHMNLAANLGGNANDSCTDH